MVAGWPPGRRPRGSSRPGFPRQHPDQDLAVRVRELLVEHDHVITIHRVGQIVEGTAMALGARADLHYHRNYPVTVNARENTTFAAEVAQAVSGKVDTDTPPLMGAEDFSFMLNERPGAYIFLGNGDTAMVHHPAYTFDDSAIPFGASWYVGMAEARMPAA